MNKLHKGIINAIILQAAVIAILVLLLGCQHTPLNGYEQEPVYKYNPIERKYEITYPDSPLRYNIYEREWEFVK